MKIIKKILSTILILAFIAQLTPVFAFVDNTPQETPQKLDIADVDNTTNPPTPAIGHNESYGYFFRLKWDSVPFPVDEVTDEQTKGFINLYTEEIPKPYKTTKNIKPELLSGNLVTFKEPNLKSGTVYNTYLTAYHMHTRDGVDIKSADSTPSVKVRILTDIKIDAYPVGTNKIKIEWDDVWDTSGRINYKLYVSESSDFSNTQPMYIDKLQNIGPDNPVKVNESTGKLEYVHNVRDAGRVYYVKIAPDLSKSALKSNPETETVAVSSFILARTARVSSSETGTIWRMDWTPVVTGLSNSDIRVAYQIYKGTTGPNDIQQYMASVDDTTFYLTIPLGQISNYYVIRAFVTRGDENEDVYPNVKIQSDIIIVKEPDVPTIPTTPEIEKTLGTATEEIHPNSATLLWRAPKMGNDQIDSEVKYDIWLISNPNQIDNPPLNTKIETSLQIPSSDFIMQDTTQLGFKHVIPNLTANSTYYVKIVAKKTYTDYIDDSNTTLGEVLYQSQPALTIIITPPEGNIDQPIVPSIPPLMIKKTSEGKDIVTYDPKTGTDTITMVLKNKWYEKFEDGKWGFVNVEKFENDDDKKILTELKDRNREAEPPEERIENDKKYNAAPYNQYRIVEYTPTDKANVGYIDLKLIEEGDSLDTVLRNTLANKKTQPTVINDSDEIKSSFDGERHNINIDVNGLEPNTTYYMWLRVERGDLLSGPSEPLIITTPPAVVIPVEKPIVPEINYSLPSDTYVDLGWTFKPGYNYYLKYSTEENINTAKKTISITAQELLHASFYRVKDLNPDTMYYFWIQAESINDSGQKSQSDWSNSHIVKTLPALPPETPNGFGVKDAKDAVTKNSITFEWLKLDGLEYTLEVSDTSDFKNMKEYKAKSDSEYKVDGLQSNHRYYARLYAFDPVKKLKSLPTPAITVRTERSNEEFDSDQDIEDVLTGDYVVKDTETKNKIWTIKITDANADRFLEHAQKDNVLDYRIDLSNPPSKPSKPDSIVIVASNKIFKGLSALKENLILSTDSIQFIIRPDILDQDVELALSRKYGSFNYKFTITLPYAKKGLENTGLSFKTGKVSGIAINAQDGNDLIPVKLKRPLKAAFTFATPDWYKEGVTSAYTYNPESNVWEKADSSASYDIDNNKGYLSFEILKPCEMTVAEPKTSGGSSYEDLALQPEWVKEAVEKVTSVHKLKSIEGKDFEHTKLVSMGEAVKLMLDVMDYNYKDDYMMVAAKSGIVEYNDVSKPDSDCLREKAIVMVSRLYEIKTGKGAKPSIGSTSTFTDLNDVAPSALAKVEFAIENGMVVGKNPDTLAPKDSITRAEVIVLLEKLLAVVGEIE